MAEEYLHYLSERDARKILIGDLNELRYQHEDMSLAQSPGNLSRSLSSLKGLEKSLALIAHPVPSVVVSAHSIPIHGGTRPFYQ